MTLIIKPPLRVSAKNIIIKAASLSQILWTPAAISTALWLDAADASTITTVSGGVSEWGDKSGNGRHAAQDVSGNRPSVNLTGINNAPAISFNGSSSFLNFPSGFLNGTTNITVAMVLSSPLQNNNAIWGPVNTNVVGLELICTNIVGWPTLVRINGINKITTGLWSTDSTATVTTMTASSTATAGFLNGNPVTAVNAGGITGLSYNGIYSMGRYTGSFYAQMLMGEFAILESSASANDRQKLEGYLAHKWGLTANLPSGHPYKSTPPYL